MVEPENEESAQPRRTVGTMYRHIVVHTRLRARIAFLKLANFTSRTPVTGDLDVIVSMTTYGPRTKLIYLTIESIVRGGSRPGRYILWLDEPESFENPPRQLRRLARRGLEIRKCENFGPHKKLYPTARLLAGESTPVVTCDDDVLYPSGWLDSLHEAYTAFPDCVSGLRARTMQFEGGEITPYVTWPLCRTDVPSYRHVLTNVSGCVYPPRFVEQVEKAGTEFMELAPTADDLWLHHLALRGDFPIRQSTTQYLELLVTPGSQKVSLQNVNVERGQNDVVVTTLYDSADIRKLQAEPSE